MTKVFNYTPPNQEERVYMIEPIGNDWYELSCDGSTIGKMVSEEECRRVIWAYWNNLGVEMDYLKDEDFTVIQE